MHYTHVFCDQLDELALQLIARWLPAPTVSTALWQIHVIA